MKKLLLTLLLVFFAASCCMAQPYLNPTDSLLCEIGKKDQDVRSYFFENTAVNEDNIGELIAYHESMQKADSENQAVVFGILDNGGWPENISKEAHQAIFLVIDHADDDIQKKYFPLMEEQTAKGNVSRSALATLQDRMLMHDGKKQIYGTQTRGIYGDKESGLMRIYIWPIEDPDNVDKLREEIGLGTMAQYLELFESLGYEVVMNHNMSIEELLQFEKGIR